MGGLVSRRLGLIAVMLLTLTACGGSEGSVEEDVVLDVEGRATDSVDAAGESGSGDCTIGPVAGDDSYCADDLISELAVVPLPDSVDQIAVGTPDVGDGRASQEVYFDASVSEIAAFYDEALADAGFEVTINEGSDQAVTIEFLDPEGRSGSLLIRTAASHPSQMSIQIQGG